MYVAIRIRGGINVKKDVKETLAFLNLPKINNCVLIPEKPTFEGMLRKAKNMITWGEIKQEQLEKLLRKRALLQGDKKLTDAQAKEFAEKILKGESPKNLGFKVPLRLSPPSGGYVSTRNSYPKGDLGYRGDKINELLEKFV